MFFSLLTSTASMAYTTAAFATFASNSVPETEGASNEDEEASYADINITPSRVISVPVVRFVGPVA